MKLFLLYCYAWAQEVKVSGGFFTVYVYSLTWSIIYDKAVSEPKGKVALK